MHSPLACGPGHPELSKSYMDMASKLLTFTFTHTGPMQPASQPLLFSRTHSFTAQLAQPREPPHTHVPS